MLLKSKATKVIVWLCIMALTITAIIPSGFVMPTVRAAEAKEEWDFTKESTLGSNVSTDTTIGNLKIIANSKAYGFHDGSHGATFSSGNAIEIKVSGSTKLTIGDCQYSNGHSLRVKSADGSFDETKDCGVTCYHNGGTVVFEYVGEATTLTIDFGDFSGVIYIPYISAEPFVADPQPADRSKIEVWDFGAEQLEGDQYNNMLTVDIINGFYDPSITPGTSGVSIGSFETADGELVFNGGGSTNHRIRTTNTAITRYDDKSKTIDGVNLTGYVYSNSSSTDKVYLGIILYAGDTLTVYTGSNGGASTITFEGPDGEVLDTAATSGDGAKNVFYAPTYGMYKLYTLNEKLVVYRAIREHANPVSVSGNVDTTAAEGIGSNYKISFTNQKTGVVTEAAVSNGKYSVELFDGYTYDLALVDANGYVISSSSVLDIPKGSTGVTENITIEQVDLVTITGKIVGIDVADRLKNLKLDFVADAIYVPEITIDGDSFVLQLERGVAYDIVASGVNDYDLQTTTISKTDNGTQNITFAAKPVYDITINYSGLPASVQSKTSITFTNLEDGYTYTFEYGSKIQLRDGQYTVAVSGYGESAVVQKVTSDVKVKGAAVTKKVEFVPISVWDFAKYNGGKPGIDADKAHYLGLELIGNIKENGIYLLVGNESEVKIPVKAGMIVTLEYCYEAAFEVDGKTVLSRTHSTGTIERIQITAAEDGFISIKGISGTSETVTTETSQTYFTKITLTETIEYKEKVTVGTNKNYQTINDALAAVARMNRPNNERVEIVIDPGNYEEMLVIDMPNVSLVNAAGKDSSLEITNKGVDIGKNVVRITSYYGTGYNYYSQDSNNKWDGDILAANKENGYLSHENDGDGTTNGSYWNATVVVTADGFEAEGIVFENSFNQYISKKEAADTVVQWAVGSKGQRPTTAGDTSVQNKSFVERAAALGIANNVDKVVFNNCKFIGRQDTLYGGTGTKVAFHECDILGATDYIFGGMTAVFYKCMLRLNTSEDNNDVAYITAAQQSSGRGYLMYECTITSTTPGVDTASTKTSKPGYFGRPWQANTSEVVFFNTTIEKTDFNGKDESLILPVGWNSTLGGQSKKMYEYGTIEKSGVDNTKERAEWSTLLDEAKIDDSDIIVALFLGDWTFDLKARELLGKLETIVDEDTKVEIEYDDDLFDGKIDLVVTPETDADENDEEFVYDITLVDENGEAVQPKGKIGVKIPVPEALKEAEKLFVYREEADGSFTDMKAELDEDGNLVFVTDHFSKYVVTAEDKGATEDPGTEDPGTDEPGKEDPSPDTGAEPIVPIAATIIISAAAAIFFIKRRKA